VKAAHQAARASGGAGGGAASVGRLRRWQAVRRARAAPALRAVRQARAAPVAKRRLAAFSCAVYDLKRTGANLQETVLTPANVTSDKFGKRGCYAVDGEIYAQILYLAAFDFGAQGIHDAVVVATMKNHIYVLDAEDPSVVLWDRSYGTAVGPASAFANANHEMKCYPYLDISQWVGILSTPTVDLESGAPLLRRAHERSWQTSTEALRREFARRYESSCEPRSASAPRTRARAIRVRTPKIRSAAANFPSTRPMRTSAPRWPCTMASSTSLGASFCDFPALPRLVDRLRRQDTRASCRIQHHPQRQLGGHLDVRRGTRIRR